MFSIKMIKKLSGGNIGPDEMAELLATMGIEMEVAHICAEDVPAVFQEAAIRTMKPGAEVITLSGRLKNGDRMDALMIVQPKEEQQTRLARIEEVTHGTMERYGMSPAPAQ
jgi:hypothetical protein